MREAFAWFGPFVVPKTFLPEGKFDLKQQKVVQ